MTFWHIACSVVSLLTVTDKVGECFLDIWEQGQGYFGYTLIYQYFTSQLCSLQQNTFWHCYSGLHCVNAWLLNSTENRESLVLRCIAALLARKLSWISWMYVASWCHSCFCAVLCVCFRTGHFVVVPLNLTCQHCLQHSFFELLLRFFLQTKTTDKTFNIQLSQLPD